MSNNPQLNKNGQLQHLLTTEGLPASILLNILDTAEPFVGVTERDYGLSAPSPSGWTDQPAYSSISGV